MNRLLLIGLLLLVSLTGCEKKKYPPQLTAISPSRAPIFDEVVLTGNQFGDSPTVLFGGETADIVSQSESQLTVEVPYMSVGATTVRVQNTDGTSDPLPFTVQQPLPFVLDLTPSSGRVGSTVLIEGSFLDGITEVRFGGGTSAAASFQRVGSAIRAIVPTNATTGTICLRNATGANCSIQTFTIEIPQPAPVISGLSPSQGIGGTEITISGQNLQNVQEVKIGGQTVTATSNTGSSLKIVAPTFNSLADVAITVRTSGGTSNSWNFKGAPAPSIDKSRCVPAGLIPGSALTLKGSHFNSVSEVWLGNTAIPASQFIRTAENEITLKVPAGINKSDVRVVNQFGSHAGVGFDLVTSGNGLNTGNVGTGSTTLTTTPLYDGCSPENFIYCYNGSYASYPIVDNPVNPDATQFCRTCAGYPAGKCPYYDVDTEIVKGATYWRFSKTKSSRPLPFTIYYERSRNAYTGFVILTTMSGGYYLGNVVKEGLPNAGDIYAQSPFDGSVVRLCREFDGSKTSGSIACTTCK